MIQSLNHLSQAMYRQYAAVSQSDLKKCYENPQLFHQVKTGRVAPDPPSKSQVWGTQCEHFIRTGHLDAVVIPPALLRKDGGRNGQSKEYQEFVRQHPGKTLMTAGEMIEREEQYRQVVANIRGHELANQIVFSESAQWSQRFEFQCPFTGLGMKCEMDIYDEAACRLADIKTADDLLPRVLFGDIERYGYDIQAAAYTIAAELWQSSIEWTWWWVFIRNKPPFNVEVLEASAAEMEYGLNRLIERINRYQECEASGRWQTPTHGQSIMVYPPKWASNMESYV